MALFGRVDRGQKKRQLQRHECRRSCFFVCRRGSGLPGGVVALDSLADGAAYKGVDRLAALGCMGFDRVPASCRERQRQPVKVFRVPFGIISLFRLADGHFSPPFHRPPL
nr:MAG TPA: hypothetical protein [Caudoviricetes sp.]